MIERSNFSLNIICAFQKILLMNTEFELPKCAASVSNGDADIENNCDDDIETCKPLRTDEGDDTHLRQIRSNLSMTTPPQSPHDSSDMAMPTLRALLAHNLGLQTPTTYVVCIPCFLCKQPFTSISKLKEHLTMHAAQLNQPIMLPEVEVTNRQVTPKPQGFTCTVCSKTLNTSTGLMRHRRMHQRSRIFKCQYCKKSYKRDGYLKAHIAYRHGPMITPGATATSLHRSTTSPPLQSPPVELSYLDGVGTPDTITTASPPPQSPPRGVYLDMPSLSDSSSSEINDSKRKASMWSSNTLTTADTISTASPPLQSPVPGVYLDMPSLSDSSFSDFNDEGSQNTVNTVDTIAVVDSITAVSPPLQSPSPGGHRDTASVVNSSSIEINYEISKSSTESINTITIMDTIATPAADSITISSPPLQSPSPEEYLEIPFESYTWISGGIDEKPKRSIWTTNLFNAMAAAQYNPAKETVEKYLIPNNSFSVGSCESQWKPVKQKYPPRSPFCNPNLWLQSTDYVP